MGRARWIAALVCSACGRYAIEPAGTLVETYAGGTHDLDGWRVVHATFGAPSATFATASVLGTTTDVRNLAVAGSVGDGLTLAYPTASTSLITAWFRSTVGHRIPASGRGSRKSSITPRASTTSV